MPFPAFWQTLGTFADNAALLDDGGRVVTYAALEEAVSRQAQTFASERKKLVFFAIESSCSSIISYLSLLRAGHAIHLCGNPLSPALLARYEPDMIVWPRHSAFKPHGYSATDQVPDHIVLTREREAIPCQDQLALLLTTSGSTGSPKLVRLSWENIAAAAYQVRAALAITQSDRAVTSLPLPYVFGLSVLHSHLCAGASIVLSRRSLMNRAFWDGVRQLRISTIAGVPWTYRLMRELGICPTTIPSLRSLTQSGAKLDRETRSWLVSTFTKSSSVYFMYGQTEAAGRICVLPPELAAEKPDSVGRVVPDGGIFVRDGELVYRGPNVMLGYAERRSDLGLTDCMGGVLPTSDLGEIDRDGCVYLTGRRSRICKILGSRINLDEVEAVLASHGPVAASSDDTTITIWCERASGGLHQSEIAQTLGLPREAIRIRTVPALPRLQSGKVAYEQLVA
jgi:acyl-coenzyme A synthetase/AMP-(fatty) acid ligase